MTLYELILAAKYNICENGEIGLRIGKQQLDQIEKEMNSYYKELYDEVEEY